jgi:hypothetical protein
LTDAHQVRLVDHGRAGYVARQMSTELTVYLQRDAMPDPSDWALAIVERGFPAELDPEFDVDSFSGYLSCRFRGSGAGFEYSSGPIEFIDDVELPEDFDFSVTFCTDSDPEEFASSVVCAAVLCSLSDGVLVDPQADLVVSAADAISWARDMMTEVDS